MEKNIILVDFENMQYINAEDIRPDTKIIVFVGYKQNKAAINFAIEKLENVSSIDLIKIKRDINVEQKNALDFFIAHYLGIFIEKYNLQNLNYIVYSDDQGFDPLIKHLTGNNISIKKIDKKLSNKTVVKKVEKGNDSTDVNNNVNKEKTNIEKYYNKLIENIKKTDVKQMPKTRKGLEGRIKTLISGKNINEKDIIVKEIMEKLMKNNIIKIDNKNKAEYIRFLYCA
jgi:hypothetical protein